MMKALGLVGIWQVWYITENKFANVYALHETEWMKDIILQSNIHLTIHTLFSLVSSSMKAISWTLKCDDVLINKFRFWLCSIRSMDGWGEELRCRNKGLIVKLSCETWSASCSLKVDIVSMAVTVWGMYFTIWSWVFNEIVLSGSVCRWS